MSERTFLQFRVGPSTFGLAAASVVEIIRVVAPTPVPDPSPDLLGVINLRARLVPVFDLCRSLSLGERPIALRMYIVVADVGDDTLGVLVDDVLDVAVVPESDVRVSRAIVGMRSFASAVARVGDEMVTLLELAPLLERLPSPARLSES